VVAVDPVNFEKPYTEKLEGVSTVYKSTPPDRNGEARLTPGYPSITAQVVNTRIPTTTYAEWFSYTTDFVSENVEIQKTFDATTNGVMLTTAFTAFCLYVLETSGSASISRSASS